MRIIAIAIVGANGVIGDGERQPFEIAEDWARFKQVTRGHPLIMGRRTHEAIGRWLPCRTTIVVTSRPESIELPSSPQVTGHAVNSLAAALDLAGSLDLAGRHHPGAVRIQQQPGHHRRVMCRAAATIRPIRLHELRQIQLRNRVQHEPRQMLSLIHISEPTRPY